MDLTYLRQARYAKLINDYKGIAAYMDKPRRMNYVQFDYDVSHELTLFMIEPDFDFDELNRRADEILKVMPAIKRIFAQPFIHLKEHDIILPVESVRIVNNNTLTHIASHSELWTDVKKDEIKPEKLLSRTYEDNYGIYENMVFCNVVDDILAFTRANIRILRELIYTNQTIEINILERVNHLNYFLALGKLHIGYSRNFENYYPVAERCLNKLEFILSGIVSRLKRPVYKNNRNRPAGLKIHKTNILSMHKEYHQVYKLAKSFLKHNDDTVREVSTKEIADLQKNYFFFCEALCIFAIGHFNFTCDEKKTFDLAKARLSFSFKGWTLKMETFSVDKMRLISLEVNKDKPYTVILIPSLDGDDAAADAVKSEVQADEYIVCSPYEERDKGVMLIDISSMESFRRLQQVVLRAMIYSDLRHEDCPFCNSGLTFNAEKSVAERRVYNCASCRTEIREEHCPDTGEAYYCTKISDFTLPSQGDDSEWLAKRKAEGKMYFRNITDIDGDGNAVCPHCGKVH